MRRIAPFLLAGLVLCAALTVGTAMLTGVLDPDILLARRDEIRALADGQPVAAALGFAALYAFSMATGLPLGGVFCVLAGFLFGRWYGTSIVVLAGAASAMTVFWLARSALGAHLLRRAGPLYLRAAAGVQAHGFSYVLFMRLIPVLPFFGVTLLSAALGVRTRAFLLATLLGKVPAGLIYCGLGQEIGQAATMRDLLSTESLASLVALAVLALAPVVYRRVRAGQLSLAPSGRL